MGGFKSGFSVYGSVLLIGLLWVSSSGAIKCLVNALIVGFVYGLKVGLFKVSNSGVIM
jgi:hypothetical protein